MPSFKRFEEIEAWKLGRELNQDVYAVSGHGAFGQDFGLRDERIRRDGKIAEGFARRSPADFARFLTIARASTAEGCSQLYLAIDLNYLSQDDFDRLYRLAQRIGGSCSALIRYLRSSSPPAVREPDASWAFQDTNPEP